MADANIRAVITAKDEASTTLKQFGNNVDEVGSKVTTAMKVAGVAAFAALAAGVTAAARASWDQVDAVQQATVALKAYEKDGNKVSQVLSDLVKYARSDLGVLFNRKDLFQSAQSLKLMGDNTSELVDHVKILSRSVGLGLSNWDELNLIVGRVGSTGRLTGIDFDNLTKAGFKLDNNLRNTDITFSQLFENLDKGIPADALAGQAETIQGKMIRLQTAFRGVGDAILGVNSDTGQFINGGLGSRLVGMLDTLATALNNPEFKQGLKDTINGATSAIKGFLGIIQQVTAALQPLTDYMAHNKNAAEVLKTGIIAVAAALAGAVIAIGAIVYAMTVFSVAVSDAAVRVFNFMNNVYSAMAQFVGAVASGINNAISWFNSLPGRILAAVSGFGSLLYNAGRELIGGLVNGIRDAVGSIASAVGGGVKSALHAAHIPGFAVGTDFAPGGTALVGERGPEIVNLPRGSQVIPNDKIGGSSPTINVTFNGVFTGNQMEFRKLAKQVFEAHADAVGMGTA